MPIGNPHHEVEHPDHYNSHPSGVECRHFSTHMNFNLGNAFKYLWRAGLKGDELVDLQKALFYLNEELARVTNYREPPARRPDEFDNLTEVLDHWSKDRKFIMLGIASAGFRPGRFTLVATIGRLKFEIGKLTDEREAKRDGG